MDEFQQSWIFIRTGSEPDDYELKRTIFYIVTYARMDESRGQRFKLYECRNNGMTREFEIVGSFWANGDREEVERKAVAYWKEVL